MRSLAIFLATALACAACASRAAVDYIPTNPPPRPVTARAPEAVPILRPADLRRPYVEIGLLESLHQDGTAPDAMLRALRARAAKAGCDAVVLLGDNELTYQLRESDHVLSARRRQGHRAVCIVYP